MCPASADLNLQLCSTNDEALHDNMAVSALASVALFVHLQIPLQILIRPIRIRHWLSDCYVGDSVAEYILGEVLTDSYLH